MTKKRLLQWSIHGANDGWVSQNEDYFIVYKNNEFIAQYGDPTEWHVKDQSNPFRTLKQAKAWCERKERKRFKNA